MGVDPLTTETDPFVHTSPPVPLEGWGRGVWRWSRESVDAGARTLPVSDRSKGGPKRPVEQEVPQVHGGRLTGPESGVPEGL